MNVPLILQGTEQEIHDFIYGGLQHTSNYPVAVDLANAAHIMELSARGKVRLRPACQTVMKTVKEKPDPRVAQV